MPGVSFTWKGPDVSRHLRAKLAPGARRVAEVVAARARANAPVLTGALRASIDVESTGDPLSFRVVARAIYAYFVEFGWSRAAANPFMRRAIAESVKDVQAAFRGK